MPKALKWPKEIIVCLECGAVMGHGNWNLAGIGGGPCGEGHGPTQAILVEPPSEQETQGTDA